MQPRPLSVKSGCRWSLALVLRPADAARMVKLNQTTAFRYFQQWKKLCHSLNRSTLYTEFCGKDDINIEKFKLDKDSQVVNYISFMIWTNRKGKATLEVTLPSEFLGSGGWIRTNDLRVMSPTSFHCSTPR